MKKVIVVKEYDSIIESRGKGDSQSGDSRFLEVDPAVFKSLEEAVYRFDKGQSRFADISRSVRLGDVLKIRNLVGTIQINRDIDLQILPKIEINSQGADGDLSSKILMAMLGYLKDFPGKPSDTAHLPFEHTSLFDCFVRLYLRKIGAILQRGIRSGYITIRKNVTCVKGRIDVTNNLRENFSNLSKFFCEYDEYLPDCLENRIIKTALAFLEKQSLNFTNNRLIRLFLNRLQNVSMSKNFKSDWKRITFDRNNEHYREALEWSVAFLSRKSLSFSTGETRADTFLFPMEKVFESFIGRLVARIVRRRSDLFAGWNVKIQGYKTLFDNPAKFRIRPDIRLFNGDKNLILDTKWKRLDSRINKNGISQNDMYQMYSYAKRYHANHVWLLYPLDSNSSKIKERRYITINDLKCGSGADTNVTIHIEFVDLSLLLEPNSKSVSTAGLVNQLTKFLQNSTAAL